MITLQFANSALFSCNEPRLLHLHVSAAQHIDDLWESSALLCGWKTSPKGSDNNQQRPPPRLCTGPYCQNEMWKQWFGGMDGKSTDFGADFLKGRMYRITCVAAVAMLFDWNATYRKCQVDSIAPNIGNGVKETELYFIIAARTHNTGNLSQQRLITMMIVIRALPPEKAASTAVHNERWTAIKYC